MLLVGDDPIPLAPDAPSARQWLEDELRDSIYHESRGLVERIFAWLSDFFSSLFKVGSGSSPILLAVIVLVVIAVIVGVALLVAGPVRRRRRVTQSAQVLADENRSAHELRASSSQHAQSGQWRLAVLDLFRALVRSLEDRVILDERAGRTADEAARAAAERFPALAYDLVRAGQMFDAAFYGEREVDEAGFNWLRDVDTRLVSARPELPATPASAASQGSAGGEIR